MLLAASSAAGAASFRKVPLLWAEERCILEPFLWSVLLHFNPISEEDIVDPLFGLEGRFLQALRANFRRLLPHITPDEEATLLQAVRDIRALLFMAKMTTKKGASVDPTLLFRANIEKLRQVEGLLQNHQIKKLQESHPALANKVKTKLDVSRGLFSASFRQVLTNVKETVQEPQSHQKRTMSPETSMGPKKVRCRFCKERMSLPTGMSAKDFFTKHNEVCVKKTI